MAAVPVALLHIVVGRGATEGGDGLRGGVLRPLPRRVQIGILFPTQKG